MKERWDVYDEEGNKLNKVVEKGELLEDEYHLVVIAWLMNKKNEVLIQKRAENLRYAPGVWAIVGGSALAGEDSLQAIKREIREELGIIIKNEFKGPVRYVHNNALKDTWFIKEDIPLEDFRLQVEEVSDVKWVTIDELKTLIKNDDFFKSEDRYYDLTSAYLDLR